MNYSRHLIDDESRIRERTIFRNVPRVPQADLQGSIPRDQLVVDRFILRGVIHRERSASQHRSITCRIETPYCLSRRSRGTRDVIDWPDLDETETQFRFPALARPFWGFLMMDILRY
jgi:hypothetical protein